MAQWNNSCNAVVTLETEMAQVVMNMDMSCLTKRIMQLRSVFLSLTGNKVAQGLNPQKDYDFDFIGVSPCLQPSRAHQ